MVVYLFVVIQIYNKFSGFLLFFTIIYNLSLEMSDEPYLWTVRGISYHAKGIENSAHLYCIERSFSTYWKIVVTERKL